MPECPSEIRTILDRGCQREWELASVELFRLIGKTAALLLAIWLVLTLLTYWVRIAAPLAAVLGGCVLVALGIFVYMRYYIANTKCAIYGMAAHLLKERIAAGQPIGLFLRNAGVEARDPSDPGSPGNTFESDMETNPDVLHTERALALSVASHVPTVFLLGRYAPTWAMVVAVRNKALLPVPVSGADWQAIVRFLCREASIILMYWSEESPGLAWELEYLVNQGLTRKLVFAIPPKESDLSRIHRFGSKKPGEPPTPLLIIPLQHDLDWKRSVDDAIRAVLQGVKWWEKGSGVFSVQYEEQ